MTKIFRRWIVPGLCFATAALLALPAAQAAAPAGAAPGKAAASAYGAYLAGLYAQQQRNYSVAASMYAKALAADPAVPELVSRSFLMDIADGQYARAEALAPRELALSPHDAIARLLLAIADLRSGNNAGALSQAERMPLDGIHRFVRPLAVAWSRVANGDVAGADAALEELDNFPGFAPLKYFQLGLIYDFAGHAKKAEQNYGKTIDMSGKPNWRLTDIVANFYARQGDDAKAKQLFARFIKDNGGSELAESVLASRPPGTPQPIIRSPADGLAEGLFDLASILNQPETIDLALLYNRLSLDLRPNFPLAQLLLSDILNSQNRPRASLAALREIPKDSPYSWSARLREAGDLAAIGKTDEAIAEMKSMAAQQPKWATADIQLGDLQRSQKKFAEAAASYSDAIKRLKAANQPVGWSLYYSYGIALDRSGDWDGAQTALMEALKLRPDEPLVLNYLGYSWIDRHQKLHEALKMVQKAVKLRPEDGYIIDSLGWAYYQLGDYSGAVKYLEKAVELVPDDPTINDHLGDAYWRDGRPIEARFQWRQALQFGPKKDEIKPIEAKLERGMSPKPGAGGG